MPIAVSQVNAFKGAARIKKGWEGAGRTGTVLAGPIQDEKGQEWMVVQWHDEDDPDLFKAVGLEVAISEWRSIK